MTIDAWFEAQPADIAYVQARLAAKQATAPVVDGSPSARRARLNAGMPAIRRDETLKVTAQTLAGRPAEKITPELARKGAVLYLHGGAFILGSPQTHRGVAARLATALGCAVTSPDYRLAPEHPFPAAYDDAVESALALRDQTDGPLILAGDSAGGALALVAALALRDRGVPLSGLLMLSPWLDPTCSMLSHSRLAERDPILSRNGLLNAAREYLAGNHGLAPGAFPLTQDLSGLPPTLVQVGEHEILFDDSVSFAAMARRAGVAVTLQAWRGMCHVWHAAPDGITATDAAFRAIAAHRPHWALDAR